MIYLFSILKSVRAKKARSNSHIAKSGFTLIELSIVLVIIGLIIGGVLVGNDLINSARIRSQISQFQEYSSVFNTFKTKYNCLPGDCSSASAFSLGIDGNGNGILEAQTSSFGSLTTPDGHYDGELPQFFVQLKASGIAKYNFGGNFTGGEYPLLAISDSYGMIASGRWHAGVNTGTEPNSLVDNYNFPEGVWLQATVCKKSQTVPIYANDGCGVMTPNQAQVIDNKIDDGDPLYGKVWSYTSRHLTTYCLNGTYDAYNLTNTYTNCQMSYRLY